MVTAAARRQIKGSCAATPKMRCEEYLLTTNRPPQEVSLGLPHLGREAFVSITCVR
jgi:hypothetical protein